MRILYAILFVSWICGINCSIIETPLGKIRGHLGETITGRKIHYFEGVPYAQPPIGALRFEEPKELEPWKGAWEATNSIKCMQFNEYAEPDEDHILGDEDCLYLNVYTPQLDQDANLDVIVYIHGGGFMFTHGGYLGPEILLDENVILVKINYRLGPLGFLSTEDNVVPGNNGIKDQIAALKWIKNNIKYFGGNPNSVTITGMSAGGASVHTHYLTPKSRDLFHRGHSQSGTTFNPWVIMEAPLEKTLKLASLIGCPTNRTTMEIVSCLKTRSGRQIVNTVKDFQPWLIYPFSPFAITVDKWAKEPILADHPHELLQMKQVADKPWIASFTGAEGLFPMADFYSDPASLKAIDAKWNTLVPLILDYNYTVKSDSQDMVSEKIRAHYLGEKKVSKESFMDLIRMAGDRLFVFDIVKTAQLQSAAVKSPVYSYYFTYRGSHSQSEYRAKSNDNLGASHGDDTSYILKIDLDMLATEENKKMSKIMVNMLTSFSKTGEPKMPIDWTPLSKNTDDVLNYLQIDSPNEIKMENATLGEPDFWKSLPIIENDKI